MSQKFEHRKVALWHPDEHGMAYLSLNFSGGVIRKTVQRQVNLDLNDNGEVVGIEFFDCPPIADDGLIKGASQKDNETVSLLTEGEK